ncbi:MAG: DNA (cytosine-5-)-methyltransferase [Armatimonadetes bacterium]|nr:DNA (cytosine-5-)-methyltransferase [Armatimonadota bacterium]
MSTVVKPKVASFFSGIGGFDLGFQRAGYEIAFQCEIDTFCNTILEKNWSNVKRKTDIKKVTAADVPAADIWVGGFPCQDVSLARMGKRDGLRGSRSGLFYEFARLVGEQLPRVLLIENVPGLLSSHDGRDFGIVVRTLADLGYSVGWRVLNSRHFGVAQSRQRVFIVGCHRDRGGSAKILFEPECSVGNDAPRRPNGKESISPFKSSFGDSVKGPIVQGLAYCLYACSARHTGTDWSRTYVTYPDGRVRRLTPKECEGIQGFPTDWTLPDEQPADIDKLDSLRYHALGNAVTVPVAEWLAERMMLYLGTQMPFEHEVVDVDQEKELLLARA